MWHIYTMEYYSAIKRKEIELFVMRWNDLETVIQSEVSQKEKNTICYHLHVESKIWVQMNLFTKQKQTHRFQKQTSGYQRGNVVGRDKLGAWD